MKLIVDIPDEAYNRLLTEQHLPNRLDIEYFIVHGIPLDNIRAEIENVLPKAKFQTGKTSVDVQMMIPQEKVLQIIDKYRGRSE